jgi:hypothetical protein
VFPFPVGNDAREEIKREDAFRPLVGIVDGKGHPLGEKSFVGDRSPPLEFLKAQLVVSIEQFLIMCSNLAGLLKHLVKKRPRLISRKQLTHEPPQLAGNGSTEKKIFRDAEDFAVGGDRSIFLTNDIFEFFAFFWGLRSLSLGFMEG